MNAYLITAIVFGVILCIVYVVVTYAQRTVYLPVIDGAQESVEDRKKRAEKKRSRMFVFGIGGTFGLCLLTMFIIWASGPAKIVYAAFNPTATPTVTFTPTITHTPTVTFTPTASPTPAVTGTPKTMLTTLAGAQTPVKTFIPSGSSSNGSSGGTSGGSSSSTTVTVLRTVVVTRVVPMTHIVYLPVTVVVTAKPISSETPTATPTVTNTPSETPTVTFTPTESPTPSATATETPTEVTP